MADGESWPCPACGAPTGADPWCSTCGLDLVSGEAHELRDLANELAAVDAELHALWVRREALATALVGRRIGANPRPAASAPAATRSPFLPPLAPPPSNEWSVDSTRNVLLWTGATLLALSALAFTAVAWSHLGPAGRATLLVAITAMSAFLASTLQRRLPATAGAFTGLTIALALIDWQIVHRANLGASVSSATWWAIGTAAVGALAVGLGRVASPAPARRAIAILFPASAVLILINVVDAAWSAALGLAFVAAALVVADRLYGARRGTPGADDVDLVVRGTLRGSAASLWALGAAVAISAAAEPSTFGQTLAPAGVMLALALAPGVVVWWPVRARREPATGSVTMAAAVLATVIGAALTSVSTTVGAIGLLTLAAILGSALVAAAPVLDEVWTRAAQVAGVAAATAGLAFAMVGSAVAELGPLAWFGHAWSGAAERAVHVVAGPHTVDVTGVGWCAVAILAVAAIAVACVARPGSRAVRPVDARAWQAGAVALALLAILLTPVAAGASALWAGALAVGVTALMLVGAAIASRRRPEAVVPIGALAAISLFPAAGWAALTRTTSIAALVVAVVSALLAIVIGRSAQLRVTHTAFGAAALVALASVASLAAGGTRPGAGFAAAVVAGSLLVLGCLARRNTPDGLATEIVGATGMLVGATLALGSLAWLAGTLTVMVPLFVASTVRRDRSIAYGSAAGAAALGATWAWLATAGVAVVEAYSLPAALLALGAGAWAWKAARVQSWLNLGPAVALALGPTLVLAIARHDDARAVAVGVAALAVVLLGARRQLQAPLVLGTLTLVVLGVDKLGAQAVRLPRWAMLALAGALLLWVGTTFERRRDDVQRAARRLVELG